VSRRRWRSRARRRAAAGGFALIATLLVAGGASAARDHAVAGGRYLGKTSQGQATTILVSADGRSITAISSAVAYDGLCRMRPGGVRYQILSGREIAIGRGGQFSVMTLGRTSGPGSLPVIVRGAFRGGAVTGTIAATGRAAHCPAPRRADNPYRATFSAHGTPESAP
jgi:hypothetical protein